MKNFDLSNESNKIESRIKEEKINDKNLDSDYLNNQANTITNKNSNYNERIHLDEKRESINNKHNARISLNSEFSNNNCINQSGIKQDISNNNNNQIESLTMKKIVLLEPEIKIKKDEGSIKSFEINDSIKNYIKIIFL